MNRSRRTLTPDEVFLDATQESKFNTQQMEGVFERPINTQHLLALLLLVFIFFSILIFRTGHLQLVKGSHYFTQSESNRLHSLPIFSERGLILDRNGIELAWNVPSDPDPFLRRTYRTSPGMSLLGYVEYPKKDANGFYWQTEIVGKDGIESYLHDKLQGQQGKLLVETDALLEVTSSSVTKLPIPGETVSITIDARIQEALHDAIERVVDASDYTGGAGVIMDIHTGELIALVSYPSYDPNVLADKDDPDAITRYLEDPGKPFLDRTTTGLYTPGSIVKPFVGLGALAEGVITPSTTIESTGKIEVVSQYDATQVSTFRDWKEGGHGVVTITDAIAESVNTFFYAISGGYEKQEGMGIKKIEQYMHDFGFGRLTGIEFDYEKQGVIPNPQWKREVFDDSWRLGDTYITSIGQFGFQVTPLQVTRAMAGLANKGTLIQPRIFLNTPRVMRTIPKIDEAHYGTIHQALRQTVTSGTAQALNFSDLEVAAKTGTAQVGGNKFTNSWSTGFFPYEEPQYAFAVVMERGPKEDAISASWVMRDVLAWMLLLTPEYFGAERLTDEEFMAQKDNFVPIVSPQQPTEDIPADTDLDQSAITAEDEESDTP